MGEPLIIVDYSQVDTPESDGLVEFEVPTFIWPGGNRIEGDAVDSYIPTEEAYITQVLAPFEHACKMLCYVPFRSRGIGAFIAREMIAK